MRVMGARALVRRKDAPKAMSGLIELVELDRQLSQYAEIVYMGTEKNPDINVGDQVLIGTYSGAPVPINNETLYFVGYNDILAILEE